PGVHTPVPGMMRIGVRADATPLEERGVVHSVGLTTIGGSVVSGEIGHKVAPGGRVLVPGPNGLMQSATVRQLLQGYYELEVGSSGETIWVPITGVVPEMEPTLDHLLRLRTRRPKHAPDASTAQSLLRPRPSASTSRRGWAIGRQHRASRTGRRSRSSDRRCGGPPSRQR